MKVRNLKTNKVEDVSPKEAWENADYLINDDCYRQWKKYPNLNRSNLEQWQKK